MTPSGGGAERSPGVPGDSSVPAGANLALRFVLELAALAAFAGWGWATPDSRVASVALAVGTPLVAAVVWGVFVSPKARVPLGDPARVVVEAAFFGGATAALAATGRPLLAWAFGVAAAASLALTFAFGQR